MSTLVLVTGPPGAGKSTVACVLARLAERSVLVEGDSFFGFLAAGAIEPWLPESHEQNSVVTKAAASAAGAFASGGYATVYDGVVGPWFLPTFADATGLNELEYVVLLPPLETCVQRVFSRQGHGFTDETATRKMHGDFSSALISRRHVIHNPPDQPGEVVAMIEALRSTGELRFKIR